MFLPGEQMLCHCAECLFPTFRVNDLQLAFFVTCLFGFLCAPCVCKRDQIAGQVETFKNALGRVAEKMAERFHAVKCAVDGLQLCPYRLTQARVWLYGPRLRRRGPVCQ